LLTREAFVVNFEVSFEIVGARFLGIKRRVRDRNDAFVAAGAEAIRLRTYILVASHVTVVPLHASRDSHPAVHGVRYVDHVVFRAGDHKLFILAKLFRICNKEKDSGVSIITWAASKFVF
jgi:hypothetical protein